MFSNNMNLIILSNKNKHTENSFFLDYNLLQLICLLYLAIIIKFNDKNVLIKSGQRA